MILVIIIAVAWIVILTPSLMKRRSQAVGEIGSISHFHQQLRVLEHSGPQPIVTPAYRLRSVDGSGVSQAQRLRISRGGGTSRPVGGGRTPAAPARARLPGRGARRRPGRRGDPRPVRTFDDVGQPGRWPSPVLSTAAMSMPSPSRRPPTPGSSSASAAVTPSAVMAAVFSGTLLIGFVPGASAAWILTALSGVALAAYVTVLVQLRRTAEERERKLHYLRPEGLGEPGSNVRPPPVGHERTLRAPLQPGRRRPLRPEPARPAPADSGRPRPDADPTPEPASRNRAGTGVTG